MKVNKMSENERKIMRREAVALLSSADATHDERAACEVILRYEATLDELQERLEEAESRVESLSDFIDGYTEGLAVDWFDEDDENFNPYID